MKVRALLFILISFSAVSYGQEHSEFGVVTVQELENKNYTSDTASAIVLFDKGSMAVDPNSATGTTIKRHMRIKILRKEAFQQWGNRRFFVNKEGQLKIKGMTYNVENGAIQRSELADQSILRRKYNKHLEEISIAFPNVKEGSVVEFMYTEKHFGFYVPGWKFQYTIPTRWSEYTITVPFRNYVTHMRGSLKPATHEIKYDGGYQKWLMTNIPAFVEEPLMPDKDVYISTVEFAVKYRSWNDVNTHFRETESFSDIISKHNYLKRKVDELTAGFTDSRQKIKSISDYIKHEVQFNGVHDFYGINPNELFDKKTGTAGDINLLFASMLEKAGLKVNMVLLSTRDHGFILEGFPSLSQFNYVVCEVTLADGELLVDATEKYLPFDLLPPGCFNHKGFLVSPTQYGWISIEPLQRDKIMVDANFTLSENGQLKGKLRSFKEGYAAFKARKKFMEGGEDEYRKDFIGGKLWNIERSEILNMNAVEKPVIENYDLSLDDYATISNGLIYFNPHIFLREELNPLTNDKRQYPVEFGKLTDNTVVCTITIPENYAVEELPQNKVIVLPGNAAKCTFSTSQIGNKIMIMSKLQFNTTLFQPNEFGVLKEFYAALVSKKSENIVLRKKKV